MKKLSILVLAILTSVSLFSQYSAGTLKVSLALGNSPYVGMLSAPYQGNSTHAINVQGASWISGTSNSLVNMVGMEVKYFVADELAIKFIGGGQVSLTPGQNEIPSVYENTFDPQTDLPGFTDVKEQTVTQYLLQFGVDKYFTKGNSSIYGGIEGGFRYGAASSKSITETSAGTAISQVYGFQTAITFGAEYGTQEGLFAGVEIRPVSFAYSASTIEPVPGVSQNSFNYTVGFLVYPMLRFGINF